LPDDELLLSGVKIVRRSAPTLRRGELLRVLLLLSSVAIRAVLLLDVFGLTDELTGSLNTLRLDVRGRLYDGLFGFTTMIFVAYGL
jgi:hypothetical protein